MFSLGIVLFTLLTLSNPWEAAMNPPKHCFFPDPYMPWIHWKEEQELPALLDDFTEEARDLFSELVQVDPAQRPSAREALNHPWFGAGKHITQMREQLDKTPKEFIVHRMRGIKRKLEEDEIRKASIAGVLKEEKRQKTSK